MPRGSTGHLVVTEFDALVRRAAGADPRALQDLIERYRREVAAAGTPVLEDDRTALFLYFADGPIDGVGILGDMSGWEVPLRMERVPGTDLWFRRERYEPDARLEYWIMPGGRHAPLVDPLNPHTIRDGLGLHSEFAMPRYRRSALFAPCEGGRAGGYGRVTWTDIPSSALGYSHEIFVYLPPGYEATTARYPVLYVNDGRDYIEFACLPHAAERLITQETIEPIIAVCIAPPNRHQPGIPNRMTEYGLSDAYVSFLADELVPWIDDRYRTVPAPDRRLIAGSSFGGLISFYAGFRRPGVFGMACCQSSYFSFRDDAARTMAASQPRRDLRVFADVGTYERVVGAGFIPPAERDFVEGNRRMRSTLDSLGYDLMYREYPEGHTWGNWRVHLADALVHFFGRRGE